MEAKAANDRYTQIPAHLAVTAGSDGDNWLTKRREFTQRLLWNAAERSAGHHLRREIRWLCRERTTPLLIFGAT